MRRPGLVDMARTRRSGRVMMRILEGAFRMTRLPLITRLPAASAKYTNMRWLPINEDIRLHEDAPMPVDILDRLIQEASHRVIYDKCECRNSMDCRHYPIDIGCLLMGDSALEGPRKRFHEASVEEARALVKRAVEAGLVPVVGKALIDNVIFGIKERHKLLSVCFCCECCCVTRYTRHSPFEVIDSTFVKLDGVTVEVTDECDGCGTCVDHCYVRAMRVVDGRAVMSEYCRACGRCATVCPNHAIRVSLDDPEYLDKCYEQIRSCVKFD